MQLWNGVETIAHPIPARFGSPAGTFPRPSRRENKADTTSMTSVGISPFGLLNCDKPPGMTSRDVVNVVQRRLQKVKVGHAGTLDPMADGVLVLGVGPAVRLVPHVQQYRKHYRGTFRLGSSSESGDIECEVFEPDGLNVPNLEEILSTLPRFIGCIEQTPPSYSAIHVDGKRAYQRVRAGESFEMPKRQVDIHSLNVLRFEYPEIELDVVCGSGTYIRTIGVDLARAVGSDAVMTQLRRHAIGPFAIEQSVSIDQLRDDKLSAILLSPALAVQDLPRLIVDAEASRRLGHGKLIDGEVLDANGHPISDTRQSEFEVAALTESGQLRAILRRKSNAWHPHRVFPLPESDFG